jgi:hypothetical protein
MFRRMCVFVVAFFVSTSLLAWEGTTTQFFDITGWAKLKLKVEQPKPSMAVPANQSASRAVTRRSMLLLFTFFGA